MVSMACAMMRSPVLAKHGGFCLSDILTESSSRPMTDWVNVLIKALIVLAVLSLIWMYLIPLLFAPFSIIAQVIVVLAAIIFLLGLVR